MIAIPCVLYVNEDDVEKIKEIAKRLDDDPIMMENGTILPDLDRKPYPIAGYRTPNGGIRYRVDVKVEYADLDEKEPDDAGPGDYQLEVLAKNSFEAANLALDRFHETHPIGNLDAVDVTTDVKRVD